MNTEEQRLDVIQICDFLLSDILQPFTQSDDTPEGRMITQLKWLKERAENKDLPLPVDRKWLSTLRYVYTDGALRRYASAPDRVRAEVEVHMQRLIHLTLDGALLIKPSFYPYVPRCIDALIQVLMAAPRPLAAHEKGAIQDLQKIKQDFIDKKLIPPVGGMMPYENLIDTGYSIDDIPNAKPMYRLVENLIFNGVRPDAWLTPEAADIATRGLIINPVAF